MTTTHAGSCHCGRIRFSVTGDVDSALSCNCSICQRRGSLLWFVPREQLLLLTPEQDASIYRFNSGRISHCFCPLCGMHPYGEAIGPDGRAMAAINLRCIEDFDLASVPVHHHDGRAI